MTPFIVSLVGKVTLIVAVGLVTTTALRSFGPSIRHQVLLVTLGSCLTLPILMMLTPRWDVGVLPPAIGAITPAPGALAVDPAGEVRPAGEVPPAPASRTGVIAAKPVDPRPALWSRPASLPVGWAIGFLAVLLWLAAGRIRLRRIASGSWPLTGADWERALDEERREAGVSKTVHLLSSSVVSTPLTWGSRTPVILLPEDALDWPEAHRRIVLRHELAHVARSDALSQLVAGFVCAVYWFHPLVWIAERRLRAECERACDDRVVSLGTPAAEYAAHLLEVARSARSFGAPGFLSVAMARPSQLEGRLLAVLNESRPRTPLSRGARAAALLVALFIVATLSAFRAVPRTAFSVTDASSVKKAGIAAIQPPARTDEIVNAEARAIAGSVRAVALDSTFQRSAPARDGGTLTIALRTGGRIKITGWDKPQVLLQASLRGRDWRNTDVKFDGVDGGALLESRYTGRSNSQSSSHTFDLNVPRSFNVRISSAGGGVSIAGVDGVFTGVTGGGEIEIRKANGDVEIRTGGGNIWVSDSRLTGSVSTGGGRVMIERVDGNFAGYSGSGPVTYINSSGGIKGKNGKQNIGVGTGDGAGVAVGGGASVSAGKGTGRITTTYTSDGVGRSSTFGAGGIRMNSNGGAISLPEAPDGARVTTGGGAIRIGPSAGEVYASTGGGTIDIGPARGSVEAHTGAGEVTITITGTGPHSVDATSGRGRIVLVLPRDVSANLELETAYTDNFGYKTSIESDWPLTTTETRDWDNREGTRRKYVRVRQTVGGGGGVIRVRTVNGNIVLRRSN